MNFGANEVNNVLEVSYARSIIASFYLVEGCIFPLALITGIEYAVAAGNHKMGTFDCHLIEKMVIELKDKWLMYPKGVNCRAHRDVVDGLRREDSGDEVYFVLYLLLPDFVLEGWDVGLTFKYKIDDGRLIFLLYLFLKYGKSVIKH